MIITFNFLFKPKEETFSCITEIKKQQQNNDYLLVSIF